MMIAWLSFFFGLGGAAIVLDRNGTVKRKGWRIYFDPLSCPHCKTRPPLIRRVRRSHSFQESMWGGGWICRVCGAEVDDWGHLLSLPTLSENNRSACR
jgi:hypothetical protein